VRNSLVPGGLAALALAVAAVPASIAISFVTVPTIAAADDHRDPVRKAVDALPELGRIERGRTRVVVRGLLSKRQAAAAVRLVDQVVTDVQHRFLAKTKTPDREVTLCLFADSGSYLAVARNFGDDIPSDWGFYRGDYRVALANLGASIGNLRHELVHPLLGDDFPAIPSWLNEGIAALYGTARPTRDGFDFLVNYRLRDLQRALAAGDLPSLAQLASSTSHEVHGSQAMTYYAMARYVLLFAEREGKLSELYAQLRGAAGDAKAQAKILGEHVDEQAFRAWAAKLRWR
jgi:hypothetical protein